ncbi:MAG: hypothetical protein KF764_33990 [Labilithrix sp.]|nr:hypothetical protein [Labilithrix sp.]MBX3221180.1 hypothetical protein [Labilithrix sp.]
MRRARFALRGASALLLAATAACSFTAGFDGFVGPGAGDGGGDDRNGDGSQNLAGDETGADGGGDSNRDSGAELDGPDPNVPPVFVDAGTSFCPTPESATTFCEDFDTADLTARWLREGVFGKLTSYASRSAPNVFLLDVPPTTTGGTFVSKITRAFDTSATSVVLSFDIKPERVYLGSSFFILGALEWARGEDKYSLRLVYSNGSVRLEESNLVPPPNNKDAYHPFFALPEGKWTRLTLDIVASGATPGAQLLLDGIAVGTREPLAPTVGIDPRPTLILGAVFAGNPHTGWTLRYDDVMLTFR